MSFRLRHTIPGSAPARVTFAAAAIAFFAIPISSEAGLFHRHCRKAPKVCCHPCALACEDTGFVGDYAGSPGTYQRVLLAFYCTCGPFNGNLATIDDFFKDRALNWCKRYDYSLWTPDEEIADHDEGVVIIGWYDFTTDKFDWISLFNTPRTGSGQPRGWIYVDRNLNQTAGDGPATHDFKASDGTTITQLKFRESDANSDVIRFQLVPSP